MEPDVEHVFVLCRGERGEGASPVAVARDFWRAVAVAREKYGDTGPFEPTGPAEWLSYMGNRVDELWIYRLPLLEGVCAQ